MSQMQSTFAARAPAGEGGMSSLSIKRLGLGLSTFFAISYVICIMGYLLMPDFPMQHEALAIFLPGFKLLSWQSYFLGLIESFAWGWYIAVVFVPLYNFFGRVAH
jgi:2TM family of unknown function (DUF5676)